MPLGTQSTLCGCGGRAQLTCRPAMSNLQRAQVVRSVAELADHGGRRISGNCGCDRRVRGALAAHASAGASARYRHPVPQQASVLRLGEKRRQKLATTTRQKSRKSRPMVDGTSLARESRIASKEASVEREGARRLGPSAEEAQHRYRSPVSVRRFIDDIEGC
jgi:hypothetical protein